MCNFKDVVNTKLSSHFFINLCVVTAANLLRSNQKTFFERASGNLGITLLTGKFVKAPKKSAITDHMLLEGHKASFDNFWIL